jgi:hypothetical protein
VGNGHVCEALKKILVGDVLPHEEDNDPSTLPQHQMHKIVHHLHQAPQKALFKQMMHLQEIPQVDHTQSEEQQPQLANHKYLHLHNKDTYISKEQAQLDDQNVTSLRGSPPEEPSKKHKFIARDHLQEIIIGSISQGMKTSRNQYTKEYGKHLTTPLDLLDITHSLLFNYSL